LVLSYCMVHCLENRNFLSLRRSSAMYSTSSDCFYYTFIALGKKLPDDGCFKQTKRRSGRRKALHVRREFMQRISAALHGTLGFYLPDALQEGNANAVRLPSCTSDSGFFLVSSFYSVVSAACSCLTTIYDDSQRRCTCWCWCWC
jgi:hypothetical protein